MVLLKMFGKLTHRQIKSLILCRFHLQEVNLTEIHPGVKHTALTGAWLGVVHRVKGGTGKEEEK